MAKVKVIVHIGAAKTGSSSIQKALQKNAPELAKKGIFVPDVGMGLDGPTEGHQVWAFEKFRNDLALGRSKLIELITLVKEQAESPVIIISAENLSDPNQCARIFENLGPNIDLKIVIYLRRQDDYFISAWQQWFCKVHSNFWSWAIPKIGRMANWKMCLEDWERTASPENLKVRLFAPKDLIGNDVVTDFFSSIDLPEVLPGLVLPEERSNPSLAEVVTQLSQGNRALFTDAHDNSFYNAILDLTGESYVRKKGESPLSLDERCALISAYSDSNEWVQKKYFPKRAGRLFDNPAAAEVVFRDENLMLHDKFALLTQLIFELYKRQKK